MNRYRIFFVENKEINGDSCVKISGLKIVEPDDINRDDKIDITCKEIENISIEGIKRKVNYYSDNWYYLSKKEFEEADKRFILNVGRVFDSNKDDFKDALEHALFYREIKDVEKEIIIPSLIERCQPDPTGIDYDFISNWWREEKRVHRKEQNNPWELTAVDYYEYLNTLLPEDVRITELDTSDARINTRIKGQCAYFHLKHPKGDCYGMLHGTKNVLDLSEFYK